MKAFILAIALAAVFTGPAAAASWGYGPDMVAQAQKGRDGGGGRDRGPSGREGRPDRQQDDRRDRFNDDERRALHRDLDKANRELYQQRRGR